MPTNLTVHLRCQSKNLIAATPDNVKWVTVNLQSVTEMTPTTPAMQSSSMTTTVLAANDTFVMGNIYAVTIVDGPTPVVK